MHDTLVDTSVWVDYFRTGKKSESLNSLIDSHHVVTNDLILTELVPFLLVKGRTKVIKLLNDLPRLPLRIQWDTIIVTQTECLKIGKFGIGIPDLIIAQNTKQRDCAVYSLDKHFVFLQKIIGFKLHQ